MEWTPPTSIDRLVVVAPYDGDLRADILRLKRGEAGVLPALAEALALEMLGVSRDRSTGPVVTWVPTTRARRGVRGFDQARLLARAVSRRLGLPCRSLLKRHSPAQQGRGAEARRTGPVFSAKRTPPSVLLLDDVVTTGASLEAAAEALRAAGTTYVIAGVLAAVPARGRAAG